MGDVSSGRINYVEARHRELLRFCRRVHGKPAVANNEQKKRSGSRHSLCVNWQGGHMC